MALYDISTGKLQAIEPSSFVEESVKERQDIQQWLLTEPDALGEPLLVITEEFGDWEDSRRRIDILAVDQEANLVVIEIKRTEDGGHMDLQAIRYAAMVSSMSFEDVVRTHQSYLDRKKIQGNARERLAAFFGVPVSEPGEITTVPRILLVAGAFSLEITTTVLWLVDRGIDIRCIQIRPYRVETRMLLEIRQLLPLEEASEYQVRIRQKDEVVRRATGGKQRERTLTALARNGIIAIGTEIEIVPEALPRDASKRDPRTFRAKVIDLESRDSVQWLLDGGRYSASKLSVALREVHGIKWLANNIFVHWRIVGDKTSMWNRAEELTRGERFLNAEEPGA